MNVLEKIDRLINGSPEMAAPPQRLAAAQMDSQPGPATTGNLASAIAAGDFGPPSRRSPMDNVKALPAQPPPFDRSAPAPTPERYALVSAEISRSPALNIDVVPDLITKRELEQLREMDSRWVNLNATAARFTSTAARVDHRKHLAELASKVAAADPSTGDSDSWSFEDFSQDYEIKLRTVKTELRRLEMEGAAMAKPVRQRFAGAVESLANHIEMQGRHRAEVFAVPYVTESPVSMLRRMCCELLDVNQGTSGRPALMLPFLNVTK